MASISPVSVIDLGILLTIQQAKTIPNTPRAYRSMNIEYVNFVKYILAKIIDSETEGTPITPSGRFCTFVVYELPSAAPSIAAGMKNRGNQVPDIMVVYAIAASDAIHSHGNHFDERHPHGIRFDNV